MMVDFDGESFVCRFIPSEIHAVRKAVVKQSTTSILRYVFQRRVAAPPPITNMRRRTDSSWIVLTKTLTMICICLFPEANLNLLQYLYAISWRCLVPKDSS